MAFSSDNIFCSRFPERHSDVFYLPADPGARDAGEDCRGEAPGDPDQQDGRPHREVGHQEVRID